jgi:phage terminase large subunit-like protein
LANLNFELLDWQRNVLSDKHRFKVVVAGRRAGKSRLAAVKLLIHGLGCPHADTNVMYVAPTQSQARTIIWKQLMDLGRDVIKASHINNMEITLINDVIIYVRGADRPDTLRGGDLFYLVIDEYADIKPVVWEEVLRASLSRYKGGVLFIGTPKSRNHFYDLYLQGLEDSETYDPEYKSWHLTSADNNLIDPNEIEAARRTMSSFAFKQEYLASFDNAGTDTFKEEWIKYGNEPREGSYFMACDLAGFEDVAVANTARKKRLDNSAFAIVKVTDEGKWFVRKIEYGRWDVRETAVRILKNVREFRPTMVGIEKGTTFNAVMPYLTDLMRKNGVYFHIHPLSHMNQKKVDRIVWALQGLFEHGRVTINSEGMRDRNSWQSIFLDEYLMFPTKDVHDDLIDALSLVNQLAITTYADPNDYDDEPEVLEVVCGF